MKNKKPVIAIMYDFDKTLCTKDMQEYSFIPSLGMEAEEFWYRANEFAKEARMDRILVCMYLMKTIADEKHLKINRESLVEQGENIDFFKGVENWFSRINKYGELHGAHIEHYIISSGLKEIIEGSAIKDEFREIYACEFHYDENGIADWPKSVVNYTTKTQFLFRISKGVLDITDDDNLNKFLGEDEKAIPFRNMIYIGDGLTDVPCMKLVKTRGGHSIAVYQPDNREQVDALLRDGRVDYVVPANYSKRSEMDETVKAIIRKAVATDTLERYHKQQVAEIFEAAKANK